MEFRSNFFLWFILQVVWVIIQAGMIGLYFNFTDNISGWTKPQVFLLIGLFRVIEGIYHVFFHMNLMNFPENISSGNLDFYLTRPVNSQFLVTTRYHSPDEIGTLFTGMGLVWYALIQLKYSLSVILLVKLLVLVAFGLLALYSVMLILSSLAFIFTRMTALFSIWVVVSKTLRVPINVLTRDSIIGNTLLLPLLIIVTIPSQIILTRSDISVFIIEIFSSIAMFILATKIFYLCLRRYSSASS